MKLKLESFKLRVLLDLVFYVSLARHAIVPHVPHVLHALVLYVPCALYALAHYVPGALHVLLPHVPRALRVLYHTCSCVSCALCVLVSHEFYVNLCLTCLVHCVSSSSSCLELFNPCTVRPSLASGFSSLTCSYASQDL